jgi:hypothetical protein
MLESANSENPVVQIGQTGSNGRITKGAIEISENALHQLTKMNRRCRRRFWALRKSGLEENTAVTKALEILR